ncbi:YbaB/EbfC family nucleoid-associated protein [Actinophytocola sediminis]
MTDSRDWQSRIAEDARRYRELHERLSRLAISESSPDGAVRVTVSSAGLLTDLVVRETARDVGNQVLDCVRRAQARIPDLLRRTVTELVGTTDSNAHLIVTEAQERFPAPPQSAQRGWGPAEIRFTVPEDLPTPPARATTTPTRPRQAKEETWDEERSVLVEA